LAAFRRYREIRKNNVNLIRLQVLNAARRFNRYKLHGVFIADHVLGDAMRAVREGFPGVIQAYLDAE
jgi:hypothetical protein